MVPRGTPEPLRQLGLREAAVVGELDRLALRVGQPRERLLHALALEAQPRRLVRFRLVARDRGGGALVERFGATALLAPDEIDGAPVHERQDPGARLGALRPERGGGAPDREESLLDGVLGQPLVAQDTQRETVGDASDAIVELGESRLVAPRDERDEGFVREMSEVLAHRPGRRAPGQRYHGERRAHACVSRSRRSSVRVEPRRGERRTRADPKGPTTTKGDDTCTRGSRSPLSACCSVQRP